MSHQLIIDIIYFDHGMTWHGISYSHEEAAAVPLAGLTALQSLQRGGVKAGSKVFITAGLGGVGSFAVQIAAKVHPR